MSRFTLLYANDVDGEGTEDRARFPEAIARSGALKLPSAGTTAEMCSSDCIHFLTSGSLFVIFSSINRQ
jgi:hypothetical protein